MEGFRKFSFCAGCDFLCWELGVHEALQRLLGQAIIEGLEEGIQVVGLQYIPSKQHTVADALSRLTDVESVTEN